MIKLKKMKTKVRNIKFIAIHCTGTPVNQSIESIKEYWKKTLGWAAPGYHWIIKSGGERVQLIPEEMISNGVKGYNHEIINVAYVGGLVTKDHYADTRTYNQKLSMIILLRELKGRYPQAIIKGHYQFPDVHKACPCFDALSEYNDL